MINWIKRLIQGLLSLFLKANCSLCNRPTAKVLCPDCYRQLEACQFPYPQQFWQQKPPLLAWGNYGGQLKQAIAALKYKNQPQLAEPMGQWLGEAWLKLGVKGSPIVVPIPCHPEKLKARGFNQAELIARSFCQRTGLPLKPKMLSRVKQTEAFFGLNVQERQTNIQGAFRVDRSYRKNPPRRPVILLDDIYTSGATVKEAIKTLHQQRIRVIGVVALAKTGRK